MRTSITARWFALCFLRFLFFLQWMHRDPRKYLNYWLHFANVIFFLASCSILSVFMLLFMCMHSYLRCLIVAPNIIHVGVEETVSVQLHGAAKETSMQLYFQDQISNATVSEKKSIIFNNDNNYQAIVKLKVCLYTSYLVTVLNCFSTSNVFSNSCTTGWS